MGAITGAIAEAYYNVIPEHIKNEVLKRLPEEFINVLGEFYNRFISKENEWLFNWICDKKILHAICAYIEKYPEIWFGQVFFNLGIVDKTEDKNSHDIWHIESKDMFEKITCND